MGLRFGARIATSAAALLLLSAGLTTGLAGTGGPSAAEDRPAEASPPTGGITAVSSRPTDVDDFTFDSFEAEYRLSRDPQQRSELHTIEHIVARFPAFDQNRGIIRELPYVYDGHSTGLAVLGVTDENGQKRDYTIDSQGDFERVIIAVPEGSYVRGVQHYVIEYVQSDVTRHFEDTGADEFYWDVNGTGWRQPFGRVAARVILPDGELVEHLNGDTACYRGALGESAPCTIERSDDRQFTAEATDLGPGENVTVAIGFEPGTFAPYEPRPGDEVGPGPQHFLERFPLLIWGGLASLAAGLVAFAAALFAGRGARTGRAIIAQYEPPPGVSAAVAAEMLRARKKSMTATLLDLAVRHKIRLLHDVNKDRFGAQAADASGLQPDEQWVYGRIFGHSAGASAVQPGTNVWFTPKSTQLGDTAASLRQRAKVEVKKQGLVKQGSGKAIFAVVTLMVLALALPVVHSIVFGEFVLMTVLLAVGINALIWVLLGMILLLVKRRRPTYAGAMLLDHLKGLREYIRLAEADRIRMLQSASGAEVDERFIVQVYERLLPYAVLFGFETEWQGELAKYYRESTPDWVQGSGGGDTSFMHTLPIAYFASTVASSPTTPSSFSSSSGSGSGSSFSSFSGGSSGGGFSGGGGGGGGGGGI